MIYRTSLFGLLLAALASCRPSVEPVPSIAVAYPARSEAPLFRSLIFGDWGRMGIDPQLQTSREMADYAREFPLDFIVSTGDNFPFCTVVCCFGQPRLPGQHRGANRLPLSEF
jgi:hypothetical protein